MVLGNGVFVLNNKTGEINKIYSAFDCEEISSLDWNNDGNLLAIGNVLGEV